MKSKRGWGAAVVLALAACASVPQVRHVADRGALWRIIQNDCLRTSGAPAADCAAVWRDPARRSVVLKDRHGDYQYLLLPIARVSGIESPALLAPDAPNYFAAAWEARVYVERALGRPLPRRYTSLAVNSPHGRSQDQLHIHVDCLRPEVYTSLTRQRARIGETWAPLPEPLLGHVYLARRLDGETLEPDPVRLLAAALPAGEVLGDYSLVVAGDDGGVRPGFLLLATRRDAAGGNRANGEELQDHACGLVTGARHVLEGVR